MKRDNIEFRSGNEMCAAWYYAPQHAGKSPGPCIVMAHGFGVQKEVGLDAFAQSFAGAGMSVIVFDYRHFGGSGGKPRQVISIKKQLQDWTAAVDFARTLKGVDPDRICLWGTSFSGGHVIMIAAKDERIAAVISQVPFTNGISLVLSGGFIKNMRLTFAAYRDLFSSITGGVYYVPNIGEPGAFAAMNAPGTLESVRKLYPPDFVPEENIAARIFLTLPGYSPGKKARKLKMPLLIQAAKKDRTTPIEPARKAAADAPFGRYIEYDIDHFDIYQGKDFERAVKDQLDFLKEFVINRAGKNEAA